MGQLDAKEKKAREQMKKWGIDTTTKGTDDYIYAQNYGGVAERFKIECEARETKPEDFY